MLRALSIIAALTLWLNQSSQATLFVAAPPASTAAPSTSENASTAFFESGSESRIGLLVANDPLDRVDPMGLDPWGQAIGSVIGGYVLGDIGLQVGAVVGGGFGAGAGTLVEPGGGTLVGGGSGAIGGAIVGGATGTAIGIKYGGNIGDKIGDAIKSIFNNAAHQSRTPRKGEPNSTREFPNGKGSKTVREYGPNGEAVRDTDYGHNHPPNHPGDPHQHTWDGTKRGPATPIEKPKPPEPPPEIPKKESQ